MQSITIDSLWEIGQQTQGKYPNYIVVFTVFYTNEALTKVETLRFTTTQDIIDHLDRVETTLPSSDDSQMALVYYYPQSEKTHLYFLYIRDIYDEILDNIDLTSYFQSKVRVDKKVLSPGETGVGVTINPSQEQKSPLLRQNLYSVPGLRTWQS